MTKTCSKCLEIKELENFPKSSAIKSGFRSECKNCIKLNRSRYYQKNKQKELNSAKRWNKENFNKYQDNLKIWRLENKERVRKNHNARCAKRRCTKLNATFLGYDKELKEIYKNCPKGMHVDHIIPLQGKTVSGLHVPWNLQYLTPFENLSKGNRI
jgi:hypothetical protein